MRRSHYEGRVRTCDKSTSDENTNDAAPNDGVAVHKSIGRASRGDSVPRHGGCVVIVDLPDCIANERRLDRPRTQRTSVSVIRASTLPQQFGEVVLKIRSVKPISAQA